MVEKATLLDIAQVCVRIFTSRRRVKIRLLPNMAISKFTRFEMVSGYVTREIYHRMPY